MTRPANVRLLAGQDVSAGESFSLNGKDFQFATIQVGVNPSDLVEKSTGNSVPSLQHTYVVIRDSRWQFNFS